MLIYYLNIMLSVFANTKLQLDPSSWLSTTRWLYPEASFAGIVYTEMLDFGSLKHHDAKIVKTQPATHPSFEEVFTNRMA
jgi:hypothetical protein